MSALSKCEVETMRAILRFGGRVVVSMGRKLDASYVRTSAINSLAARGYVRLWTRSQLLPNNARQSAYRFAPDDWSLTAKGCIALNEIDTLAAVSS